MCEQARHIVEGQTCAYHAAASRGANEGQFIGVIDSLHRLTSSTHVGGERVCLAAKMDPSRVSGGWLLDGYAARALRRLRQPHQGPTGFGVH